MQIISLILLNSILIFTNSFDPKSSLSNDYDRQIELIKHNRSVFLKSYKEADEKEKPLVLQAAQQYVYSELLEQVFPPWYGTDWDYNGISNRPGEGEIACGYFVSTTLKHIGFNLNRYKVAQQYSHSIVNTLCDNVQIIRNNDTTQLFQYIDEKKNQLYIIGLDNHVGFISKEDDGIYFIHSTYLDPVEVIKEKANESEALLMSNVFVLGHLTSNESIIKSWLFNTPISIKK